MRPLRAGLLAGLVVLALASSGCLAGDANVFGPDDDGGTATGTNEAGNGLALSMRAAPGTGETPLEVEFVLKAVDAAPGVPWTLDPGDGSQVRPSRGLPAEVQHTYTKVGTFTVTFTVEDGLGGSKATLTVRVTPATGPSTTSEPTSESETSTTSSSSAPPPPPSSSSGTGTTSSSSSSSTTSTSNSTSSSSSGTSTSTSSSTSSSSTDTGTSSSSSSTAPPGNTTTETSTAAPPSDTGTQTSTSTETQTSSQTQTQSETSTSSDPPA